MSCSGDDGGAFALTRRSSYGNDKPSALMVASYATFEARLRRQSSESMTCEMPHTFAPDRPTTGAQCGDTGPAPAVPSSLVSSPSASSRRDSLGSQQEQPACDGVKKAGSSCSAAGPGAANRSAAALSALADTNCVSLSIAASLPPSRRLRPSTRLTATHLALSVRSSPGAPWRALPPTAGLAGQEIVYVPLAPDSLASAELRVELASRSSSAPAKTFAVVPLAAALAASGTPNPSLQVGYTAPLRRGTAPNSFGTVTLHAAATPPVYLAGAAPGAAAPAKRRPWSLLLSISHAASVSRDVRGSHILLQRVCANGAPPVTVARAAAAAGRSASMAAPAELLRHCCSCGGDGGGHAVRVEWRRGGATGLARLQLALEDLRLLHTRDILGPCVWGGRGGTGARLVVVVDAVHSDDESRLSLTLTR
jgi:hypothetical protein